METNRTFYQNEVRNVRIKIYDQNHQNFEPDSAYASVEDDEETEVIPEESVTVNGNEVYMTVDEDVTENTGIYYIIWKIIKNDNTYYHKTRLMVTEL